LERERALVGSVRFAQQNARARGLARENTKREREKEKRKGIRDVFFPLLLVKKREFTHTHTHLKRVRKKERAESAAKELFLGKKERDFSTTL